MRRIKSLVSVCVPILVGGTVLSLLILPGCQSEVNHPPGVLVASDAATAPRVSGDMSAFEFSNTQTGPTPREDLFRLVDALDEAYQKLGFQPPYPNVRIVSPKHSLLSRWTVALAARNASGQEFIYVNRHYLIEGEALLPLMLHELAHLQAWRRHGMEIKPHGREFMAICKSVTEKANCTADRRNACTRFAR